jgi:PAS domain S-box-containing protein
MANLAEIVDQLADAIIFADVHGIIRYWNAAAEALFGFTIEEALGQSLDLIIPERLRDAHWVGFNGAMASGNTRLAGRATTTRALHKSGQRLFVEMSFSLIRSLDARIVGSAAMARDVTRRYEKEKSSSAAHGCEPTQP